MASRVTPEIRRLLRERKIVRIKPDRELVLKEIKGAEYDLEKAKRSIKQKDFKWTTIQAYYAMFHSARVLLYSEGYREKSHRSLLIALRELFIKSGKIEEELIQNFEDVMDLREEADYGLEFSESGAKEAINHAKRFLKTSKETLKIHQSVDN